MISIAMSFSTYTRYEVPVIMLVESWGTARDSGSCLLQVILETCSWCCHWLFLCVYFCSDLTPLDQYNTPHGRPDGTGIPVWINVRAAIHSCGTASQRGEFCVGHPNVVLLLGQRRRRWPNIETTLCEVTSLLSGWLFTFWTAPHQSQNAVTACM